MRWQAQTGLKPCSPVEPLRDGRVVAARLSRRATAGFLSEREGAQNLRAARARRRARGRDRLARTRGIVFRFDRREAPSKTPMATEDARRAAAIVDETRQELDIRMWHEEGLRLLTKAETAATVARRREDTDADDVLEAFGARADAALAGRINAAAKFSAEPRPRRRRSYDPFEQRARAAGRRARPWRRSRRRCPSTNRRASTPCRGQSRPKSSSRSSRSRRPSCRND